MNINFFAQNIEFPAINQNKIIDWINIVAKNFDKIIGEINYIFTDDETILDVNRKFLNHDYYTDIITFDYSRRKLISGDLYISLDTVKSNASAFDKIYEEELHRVIIHGILHLCGINDKGPGEREIMENNENQALKILSTL